MVFEIKIKWAGQLHSYDLGDEATLGELKEIIQQKTSIRHDRQKIMGLKCQDTDVVKTHYKVKVNFPLICYYFRRYLDFWNEKVDL